MMKLLVGDLSMDDNQKTTFETMTITIGIVTVLLAIIVLFIFLIQGSVEKTRLKHETCMVETFYTGESSSRVISRVVEYCGPNQKESE